MNVFSFNKDGYDPFIDFLKAYSILFVVIGHCLPVALYNYTLFWVWGGMQVPMFILIQTFHVYKKGVQPKLNWVNLLKRIFLPFVTVQFLIIGYKALTGDFLWTIFITSGGYGRGSYYIWIYLQIAFLLVLLWPWLRKLSLNQALISFLILSIVFEFLFSVIDCPSWLYRLLCVRYIFLIPLGLIWVEKGILMNLRTVMLSILSIFAVLFFVFTNYDLEPFFFNTGWKIHRWLCYFYIPFLLTYGLWLLFGIIKKSDLALSVIKETAKSSYEIYLIQMLVFVMFPIHTLSFIPSTIIRLPIWMLLTFFMSVVGGILFNRVIQSLFVVKRK